MASWQNRAHAHECQHRRTNSNGQPSAASSGNRRSGAQPRTAAVARERKPLLAVLGVRCPGSRAGGLGGRDDGHRALRRHVVVVLHVRPVDHIPPGAQGAPRVSQSSRTIELSVMSLCILSHAPILGALAGHQVGQARQNGRGVSTPPQPAATCRTSQSVCQAVKPSAER